MREEIEKFLNSFSKAQISCLMAAFGLIYGHFSGRLNVVKAEVAYIQQDNEELKTKLRCIIEAADRDLEMAGRDLDYVRRKFEGENERMVANVYGVNLKKLKSKYALNETLEELRTQRRSIASAEEGCGL